MIKIFVTATGTNIGKTLVTSAICNQLLKQNIKYRAIKPVVSGWEKDNNDTIEILKSQNKEISESNINDTSPWRFDLPLSPDMAMLKENKIIDFNEILEFCKGKTNTNTIIEGAGGLMSPICVGKTNFDLAKALNASLILVSGTYLGSINHTLMALDIIKNYNIDLKYLVISESDENNVGLIETFRSISSFTNVKTILIKRIAKTIQKWLDVPYIELL